MADLANTTRAGQSRWPVGRVVRLVAVILAELCIVPAIFVPFLTASFDGRDVTGSLLTTPFLAFTPTSDGPPEGWSVALGIAFLGLLLVMVASVIVLPLLTRTAVPRRLNGVITLVVVLLGIGALGAWVVVGVFATGSEPRTLGPGLPLLTVGAAIAALATFLPASRTARAR
jgi:hypothetical protein